MATAWPRPRPSRLSDSCPLAGTAARSPAPAPAPRDIPPFPTPSASRFDSPSSLPRRRTPLTSRLTPTLRLACLVLLCAVALLPGLSLQQDQKSKNGCTCTSYCNILASVSATQPICQTPDNCGRQIAVGTVTFWGDDCDTIDAPTRTDTSPAAATVSVIANYTPPTGPNQTVIIFTDGASSGNVGGGGAAGGINTGLPQQIIAIAVTVVFVGTVAVTVGYWYIRQRKPLALFDGPDKASTLNDGASTSSAGGRGDRSPKATTAPDLFPSSDGAASPALLSTAAGSETGSATPVPTRPHTARLSEAAFNPHATRGSIQPPVLSTIPASMFPAAREASSTATASDASSLSDGGSSTHGGGSARLRQGMSPSPDPATKARRARLAELVAPVGKRAFTPAPGGGSGSDTGGVSESEDERVGGRTQRYPDGGIPVPGPGVGVGAGAADPAAHRRVSSFQDGLLGKAYTVVLPHKPTSPDEIHLKRSDAVFVFEPFSDGWAYGLNATTGKEGVFPMSALNVDPATIAISPPPPAIPAPPGMYQTNRVSNPFAGGSPATTPNTSPALGPQRYSTGPGSPASAAARAIGQPTQGSGLGSPARRSGGMRSSAALPVPPSEPEPPSPARAPAPAFPPPPQLNVAIPVMPEPSPAPEPDAGQRVSVVVPPPTPKTPQSPVVVMRTVLPGARQSVVGRN